MPRKRKGGEERRAGHEPVPEPPVTKGDAAPRGATQGEPQYTELILVAHAGNLAEAELFKTELEAHGIPAILEGEGAGVAGIPDVGAGVPILVPEEFADQAAELIAELEAAKPEAIVMNEDEDTLEEDEDTEDVEEVDDLDELDDVEEEDLEEEEDLDEEDEDDDEEDEEEWDEEDEEEDEDEEDEEDWDDDEEDDEDWDDDDR